MKRIKNNAPMVFMGCESSYDEADLVIFGAPFDGTCSYRPGSRFAGSAVRSESYGIETYSPYLEKDLTDFSVFDAGELDLPFGNTCEVLERIEEAVSEIASDGKIPLMIGGEHLVTLGSVRAIAKKYPDLNIIHFDAHADLRDDYLGEKFSHATVIRRCHELIKGKIYQFGIRSMTREEDLWAGENVVQCKYDFKTLNEALSCLSGKPIYLTIDLDVLDPSIFPGTGTPEPGGASFTDLISAVHRIRGLDIVACDVNELAPHYDSSGVSTAVACKVIRELILSII
ncbi:MAG: agmatinase [Synergistaceae bacterium]|nr:agmatinase [Synergistaceae bacterium]